MAEASAFGGIVQFFDKIGVYDVVLPFLLVFTIVFAILEKTKVLGLEEIEGKKYTRKNLNAMVAFVVSFLVIASSRLVEAILSISSNVVLLLLAAVFFLMLVGVFYKEGEPTALEGGWKKFFMIIMFVGILLIFFNAIKTESGKTWLEVGAKWIGTFWSAPAIASIILIIIIIIVIIFVTGERTPSGGTGGPKK